MRDGDADNWVFSSSGGIDRIEARFSGAAFTPHRHDTYAIGITLAGVQAFDYRGASRHSLPGQMVVLQTRKAGRDFLHVCVDDASRLAYAELLPPEGQHDTTAFLRRALDWLNHRGVSKLFASALQEAGARHVRPRPYTPRTNGKAERFIQTSLREWAYARICLVQRARGAPSSPGPTTTTSAAHTPASKVSHRGQG